MRLCLTGDSSSVVREMPPNQVPGLTVRYLELTVNTEPLEFPLLYITQPVEAGPNQTGGHIKFSLNLYKLLRRTSRNTNFRFWYDLTEIWDVEPSLLFAYLRRLVRAVGLRLNWLTTNGFKSVYSVIDFQHTCADMNVLSDVVRHQISALALEVHSSINKTTAKLLAE